jgi:hypothetical protein
MKKVFLPFLAVLICSMSLPAQPPRGGGGRGGHMGGPMMGRPMGGDPIMQGNPITQGDSLAGIIGMDVSTFLSKDVAKAQSEAFMEMLKLSDKQRKQIYKQELKVADERYMDLLKTSGDNRGGGGFAVGMMPMGMMVVGMPGGMPPGMMPGMEGGQAQEQPKEQPKVEKDPMSTPEDAISDVELLKKYDGMREKQFRKILTPEQIQAWEAYKALRYERAQQRAAQQQLTEQPQQ